MSLSDIDLLPDDVNVGDSNHPDHHDIIHAGLKELKTLAETLDAEAVRTSGAETIAGVKTFSSSPIVPTPTTSTQAANKSYVDGYLSGYEPTITAGTNGQYWRGDKTWQTLDKTAVGLSNVDNTSDTGKPISTAAQTALDTKEPTITAGTSGQYWRGDKTWQTLSKSTISLGNVDNTADLDKPISTATQTALDLKADASATVTLSGAQTIGGIKTFSSSPKLLGGATVGYVWTATNADGTGAWQTAGTPATDVEWTNVLNKPTTFPPVIGVGATEAAAGNHTHTKSEIGLGNVNNTADLDKPISTLAQAALDTKVPTSRSVSTGTGLTGGGDLSTNRTISISSGGVGLTQLATAPKTEGIPFVQTTAQRAVGAGQFVDGVAMPYAMTLTSVKYRMGTADASGTTTVELRKNGSTVSGTSGTASTSPSAVTGSWSFAAGDILTVYITAVGTTPGLRLTADIIGVKA